MIQRNVLLVSVICIIAAATVSSMQQKEPELLNSETEFELKDAFFKPETGVLGGLRPNCFYKAVLVNRRVCHKGTCHNIRREVRRHICNTINNI